WNDGSGRNNDWAANISPSLNSQIKAGQHWTMTIQNAGLGYYGYLDSPSGQGLPLGTSNTPGGAQFKLETQNEINDQPHWATVLEKDLGEALAIVGLTILTGGAIDYFFAADAGVDLSVDAAGRVAVQTGSALTDSLSTISEAASIDEESLQSLVTLEESSSSIATESVSSIVTEEDGEFADAFADRTRVRVRSVAVRIGSFVAVD
ncbi:MAG TPA: hypothetical protein DC048_05225, partial [Planctomycetaceae bacterium]|nr:hypothetical protein [Planctomycetaceae bacterium]